LLSKGADPNIKNNAGESPLDVADHENKISVVELLKPVSKASAVTGPSPVESQINGAVCKIDTTRKTIRIVPWDGKSWRKDLIRVIAWDESTQLVGGKNMLTMGKFVAGSPLDGDVKDVASFRGERAVFHIEKVGDKEVIRIINMMMLFSGESLPAMVGNNGFRIVGSMKVPCSKW